MIPLHTATGTIDLAALQPEDMSAVAIGDALAKLNRFAGRTPHPWSVAAHSLLVTAISPIDLQGWALLHDAYKAFLGDLILPAVEFLSVSGSRVAVDHALANARSRLDRAIGAAWECAPRSQSLDIRRADWIAYQAELAFHFGEPIDQAEREAILRACDLIPELPQGANWIAAREAWIARADELHAMGLLRLPPSPKAATAA